MSDKLTDTIRVRVTPELKRQLEIRAARSIGRTISDHARVALEIYVRLTDAEVIDYLNRFSEEIVEEEIVENGAT